MRKFILLLYCYCFFAVGCNAQTESDSKTVDAGVPTPCPQLKELRRYGGRATLDLTIRDDKGFLVDEVQGGLGCWKGTKDKAQSDEEGHLTLSATAFVDGNYALNKDGYYTTFGVFTFEAPDKPSGFFERRCWKPIVREMVIKKKRNPIPMYARTWCAKVPVYEQPIGLDLRIVDWMKPYGKGEVADVYVTIHMGERTTLGRTRKTATSVTFDFPNAFNGVQVCEADRWSEFISSYHIDVHQPFLPRLTLDCTTANDRWLPHNQYLTFRIRSEVSADGTLQQCYYGKIYPPFNISEKKIDVGAIYLNPTPNDTNLEFDPKQNLVPARTYDEERVRSRMP